MTASARAQEVAHKANRMGAMNAIDMSPVRHCIPLGLNQSRNVQWLQPCWPLLACSMIVMSATDQGM